MNRTRELGVLTSADGPDHNVLKIKPPLVFGEAEADRLVETLEAVLGETALRGDLTVPGLESVRSPRAS